MNSAITAPQVDDIRTAAERYWRWGWSTAIAGNRLLLVADHSISAVEMLAPLATEVEHYLVVRLLVPPVILLPGNRRLLLTTSADEAAPISINRITGRGATAHRLCTLVPLPPTRLEAGDVIWQTEPPIAPILPPFTAMVAAVLSITDTPGGS